MPHLLQKMGDEDISQYGLIPQDLSLQRKSKTKVEVASVLVQVDSHSMNGNGNLPKDPQVGDIYPDDKKSNTDLEGIPNGRGSYREAWLFPVKIKISVRSVPLRQSPSTNPSHSTETVSWLSWSAETAGIPR